jgi:sugar O-acyltransferase (sialic acid O-acetyltransferase NeuD family)
MERMIIVGAGGLGRDTEAYARKDSARGKVWTLAGFLDTRPDILDRFDMRSRLLGDPRTYTPAPEDVFIAAVGNTKLRQELIAPLLAKGARFVSLRTNVQFGDRVKWGSTVFCDRATLSSDVVVGNYSYIGAEVLIGHDTFVGDYVQIGPRCFIAGRVKIKSMATIHPMATITMDVEIGEGAVIAAGAVVFGNVPPHTTVLGNPAHRFEFKAHQ